MVKECEFIKWRITVHRGRWDCDSEAVPSRSRVQGRKKLVKRPTVERANTMK